MPTGHPADTSDNYYSAAVCRRGHVDTPWLEMQGADPKCAICGGTVLTACPACSRAIRGCVRDSDGMGPAFKPAEFCVGCGTPFPWASRQAVVWHIENQLEEEAGLAEGDRRVLTERLEHLTTAPESPAAEKRQAEALQYLREKAPGAFEAALPSVLNIATAAIKAHLGLPP